MMKHLITSILIIISISFSCNQSLFAGENSINGFVVDSLTNETLIGASISVLNTPKGAISNKNGFYTLNDLPGGELTLQISFIGYETRILNVSIKNNETKRINIELKASTVTTKEINVSAEKNKDKTEISVSRISVPIQQIKNIRIGGEADVFRSLQLLPGVLTSSQISSGLFVRGGSPDQNLVLIDGSTVYNPSHLFGFISTFNAEAIKDVELIKGGFPAEYGGRLSAVLNLVQKDGNQKEISGSASLGALSSRLSLEGPVLKGSWFIGARRTYLEVVKMFISEDPTNPLPNFDFYDVNAKIMQNLSDNDKLFISGFLSSDNLDYNSFGMNMMMDIGNRSLSAKWNHIFNSHLFSSLILSTSKYFNTFSGDQSGYDFLIDNSITDYTIKGSLEWIPNDQISSKFGFETNYYQFGFIMDFSSESDTLNKADTNRFFPKFNNIDRNFSAYWQTNYKPIPTLSLQAGIRANYMQLSDAFRWEPRLAAKYYFSDVIAAKIAYGMYHQSLRLAAQPDFSFFDTWLPSSGKLEPSKSEHYIISLETTPSEGYDLNFDFYYKKMDNVSEINNVMTNPKTVEDVFYTGNAYSYGAEIFLQKKYGKLNGWIGYALGFIFAKFKDINGGKEFRPKYDRTHDLKIVIQYEINSSWDVGGSFTFQSGQSYTGASSRFESRLPDREIGRGMIVQTQRYGLRLPPSHQLNLSCGYSFKMFGLASKVIADIYNVYNHRDIWFRYFNTKTAETKLEDVRLLPIIPSVSLEVKF